MATMRSTIDGLPTITTGEERDWNAWWARQSESPVPMPELPEDGLLESWILPIEDVLWGDAAETAFGENPQSDLDWSRTFGCPTVSLVPGTKRPARAWADIDPYDSAGPDDGDGRAALTGHTIDVIDIDGVMGISSFNRLVRPILRACQIPAISIQRSRRGWHIIIPSMGGRNTAGVFPGIDVRAIGGIIVAAPTAHDDGRYFLHRLPGQEAIEQAERWSDWWRSSHSLGIGEILSSYSRKQQYPSPAPSPKSSPASAPAPAHRLAERGTYRHTGATSDRVAKWQESGAVDEINRVEAATEGSRNHTLNNATFTLARMFATTPEPGIDASAVWRDLRRAALSTGLPEDEVDDVMRRAAHDGYLRGGGSLPADLMHHEELFQARRAKRAA